MGARSTGRALKQISDIYIYNFFPLTNEHFIIIFLIANFEIIVKKKNVYILYRIWKMYEPGTFLVLFFFFP